MCIIQRRHGFFCPCFPLVFDDSNGLVEYSLSTAMSSLINNQRFVDGFVHTVESERLKPLLFYSLIAEGVLRIFDIYQIVRCHKDGLFDEYTQMY